MINLKHELLNFTPIDIKSIEESGQNIPDNIKNSVILYNKALDSLKASSEDIAIIELKRAISMNPNFHEAMNLLGICYSYIKDYSKAAEMFNKVVAAENNSIQALNYLNRMNADDSIPPMPEAKKKAVDKKSSPKTDDVKKSVPVRSISLKNEKLDILKYVIGFVIGAVLIFLLNPLFNPGKNVKAPSAGDNASKSSSSSPGGSYETKYKKLNDDYENTKKALEASNKEVDYYKNVTKLFEIENKVIANDFMSAADMLVLLKTITFKDPEKGRYEALVRDIMPRAVQTAYGQGMNLFNSRKYDDAAKKFSSVEKYGTEWPLADISLYYLGKTYIELKDSRNAIDTFQKVKNAYPGTKYAAWADSKIKQLTEVP